MRSGGASRGQLLALSFALASGCSPSPSRYITNGADPEVSGDSSGRAPASRRGPRAPLAAATPTAEGLPTPDAGDDGRPELDAGPPADPLLVKDAAAGPVGDAAQGEPTRACAPLDLECRAQIGSLLHRYTFDGTGALVMDSGRGGADGVLRNGQLSGDGSVDLAAAERYVDLPNGIVSQLRDASFEVWLVWQGGAAWQRIFDFGISALGVEDVRALGHEFLYLTPMDDGVDPPAAALHVAFSLDGTANEAAIRAPLPSPPGSLLHVAVVVDDRERSMSLYVDGRLRGTTPIPGRLRQLDDLNNWLGRSQFDSDPELRAELLEFRIYEAALTTPEVEQSFTLGPDAVLRQ